MTIKVICCINNGLQVAGIDTCGIGQWDDGAAFSFQIAHCDIEKLVEVLEKVYQLSCDPDKFLRNVSFFVDSYVTVHYVSSGLCSIIVGDCRVAFFGSSVVAQAISKAIKRELKKQ